MFNDILTGKASVEPKPETLGPYREPGQVPPPKPVAPAPVPLDDHALAAYANLADARRREQRTGRIMRGLLFGAIAIGGGLFKYGMRDQMREDAAKSAGYSSYSEYKSEKDNIYPTDAYSQRINSLADDMCHCADLACARNVQSQYHHYIQTASPSDDDSSRSADQDGTRLAECQARLEAP